MPGRLSLGLLSAHSLAGDTWWTDTRDGGRWCGTERIAGGEEGMDARSRGGMRREWGRTNKQLISELNTCIRNGRKCQVKPLCVYCSHYIHIVFMYSCSRWWMEGETTIARCGTALLQHVAKARKSCSPAVLSFNNLPTTLVLISVYSRSYLWLYEILIFRYPYRFKDLILKLF